MTFDQTQLEILLDETLDAARQVGGAAQVPQPEVQELLSASKTFVQARMQQAARASFSALLQKVPTLQPLKRSGVLSTLNIFKYIKFSGHPALSRFAQGFAVFLLVWFVGGALANYYIVNSLTTATGYSGGSDGGMAIASKMSVSNESGIVQYAQTTGLGATDSRITIARILNPVNLAGAGIAALKDGIDSALEPDPVTYSDYYPQTANTLGVGDVREYLKTFYAARLQTRHAGELAERTQIIVRGLGGRVDNAQISDEGSVIGFVLPKNNLELLRSEIKGMVNARFVVENISAENLLPQKQGIEAQTSDTTSGIMEVKKQRDELTAQHQVTIAQLTKQMNYYGAELKKLDVVVLANDASAEERMALEKNKIYYRNLYNTWYNKIYDENNRYQYQLEAHTRQIKDGENNLDTLQKRGQELLTDVDTVEGRIQFEKISLWEMAYVYLGGAGWIMVWIALGVLLVYLLKRNRSKVGVVPVQ